MNTVYKTEKGTIVQGSCFDVFALMKQKGERADLIISDIPYLVTDAKWDKKFNAIEFLQQSLSIVELKRAVILFCNKPLNADLIYNFKKNFRHDLVWQKNRCGNFMLSKKQPQKKHEDILVFGNGGVLYNPQMITRGKPRKKTTGEHVISGLFAPASGKVIEGTESTEYDSNYPSTVQYFPKPERNIRIHPTQKPVGLLEFLIKSYSNVGDTVWDFTAGSCSLAVACMNTGRKFFCVELEQKYIDSFMNLYSERL